MSKVEEKQVLKAVSALSQFIKKKDDSQDLLNSEEGFRLVLSINAIPVKSVKPTFVKLPNSPYPENFDICLIISDSKASQKEDIQSKGLGKIKEILTFTELKDRYKTYESKRRLAQTYDLFLGEDSVIPLLPLYLGKKFFEFKKLPIPIKINSSFEAQLNVALHKASFYIPTGTTWSFKIGSNSLGEQELLENVMASIEPLVKKVPQGWDNVTSIQLKVNGAPGLPVYTSLAKAPESKKEVSSKKVKEDTKVNGKATAEAKSEDVSNTKAKSVEETQPEVKATPAPKKTKRNKVVKAEAKTEEVSVTNVNTEPKPKIEKKPTAVAPKKSNKRKPKAQPEAAASTPSVEDKVETVKEAPKKKARKGKAPVAAKAAVPVPASNPEPTPASNSESVPAPKAKRARKKITKL